MKKTLCIGLFALLLSSGCATVDHNTPKSKGLWNAALFVGLLIGGLLGANNNIAGD